jgi:hypothetical protein
LGKFSADVRADTLALKERGRERRIEKQTIIQAR